MLGIDHLSEQRLGKELKGRHGGPKKTLISTDKMFVEWQRVEGNEFYLERCSEEGPFWCSLEITIYSRGCLQVDTDF
jgi:hypothetical protein